MLVMRYRLVRMAAMHTSQFSQKCGSFVKMSELATFLCTEMN